jgi:hypothetical protein
MDNRSHAADLRRLDKARGRLVGFLVSCGHSGLLFFLHYATTSLCTTASDTDCPTISSHRFLKRSRFVDQDPFDH